MPASLHISNSLRGMNNLNFIIIFQNNDYGFPELSTTQAYKKLEGLLDKNGFTDVVMMTKLTCEPLHTPDSNEFIQTLINIDSRPKIVGAPWFCDAAVLASQGGIPSVAAGPGSIEQAHTQDEWISEKDLELGADFYLNKKNSKKIKQSIFIQIL